VRLQVSGVLCRPKPENLTIAKVSYNNNSLWVTNLAMSLIYTYMYTCTYMYILKSQNQKSLHDVIITYKLNMYILYIYI